MMKPASEPEPEPEPEGGTDDDEANGGGQTNQDAIQPKKAQEEGPAQQQVSRPKLDEAVV